MLDKKGIQRIAKAIVDHERGQFDMVTLERKIIEALHIPHPSVILKVDPKYSTAEHMDAFKKAWRDAMKKQSNTPFIDNDDAEKAVFIETLGEDVEKKRIKDRLKELDDGV